MTVRRLAEAALQPESFAFSEANRAWAERTVRKYPEGRQQSAVIPLLMRAQDQEGWVTKAAIEHVADLLAMPLIRVLEVATFYTQFQLGPVGTNAHIQVCGTTPCMLRGAEDLKEVCRRKIHPRPFERNAEGTLSWEEVECQGACVNAPMVLIFQDAYEDLSPERFEEIVDLFAAGRGSEVKPGPQNGRHLSVPIGGLTSLTGDYDDLIGAEDVDVQHLSSGSTSPTSGSDETRQDPDLAASVNNTPPESDPTIDAPGKTGPADDDRSPDPSLSDELVAEAHDPGHGRTGGTRSGDAGEPAERADEDQVDIRAAGPDAMSGAANAAVFSEDRLPPDPDAPASGAVDPKQRASVDPAGRGRSGGAQVSEGERAATSDEGRNAAQPDSFESSAGDDGKGAAIGSDRAQDDDPTTGNIDAAEQDPRASRPQNLQDAPDGQPDNLRKIKGVGPVIEKKLNGLGVFHWRQIAGWDDGEIRWVDDYLDFRGRALRDDWIGQAKALCDGSGN